MSSARSRASAADRRPFAVSRPRSAALPGVTLLKRAGCLILGKTVTTEFANNHPSQTRNPHNPMHTPGGSSSGSAAAVADFMVPAALGTPYVREER